MDKSEVGITDHNKHLVRNLLDKDQQVLTGFLRPSLLSDIA